MNRLIALFGLIPMVFLLLACPSTEVGDSEDVNQEEIWQKYRAHYDAESNTLDVYAHFRFAGSKGTTLELTEPSKVLWNDKELSGDIGLFSGQYYEFSDNFFVAENIFEFTDVDEKVYTNVINLGYIELDDIDTIDANQDLAITFRGEAIGKNEWATLEIWDSEYNGASDVNDVDGSAEFIISSEELKAMYNGVVNLQIVREYSSDLQEGGNPGGSLYGEYRSLIISSVLINGASPMEETP